MALLLYIDDIIIAVPTASIISNVKTLLHSNFKMKELGPLKYFLGLEIICSNTGIVIFQRHYTLQILEDFGFLRSKPKSTPMPAHTVLSVDLGYLIDDATSYRRLVSRLLYLTIASQTLLLLSTQ